MNNQYIYIDMDINSCILIYSDPQDAPAKLQHPANDIAGATERSCNAPVLYNCCCWSYILFSCNAPRPCNCYCQGHGMHPHLPGETTYVTDAVARWCFLMMMIIVMLFIYVFFLCIVCNCMFILVIPLISAVFFSIHGTSWSYRDISARGCSQRIGTNAQEPNHSRYKRVP